MADSIPPLFIPPLPEPPPPPARAVFLAIDNDDLPRVQALIGTDPSLWLQARTVHNYVHGLTPLMYAIRTGRRAIALWLIEQRQGSPDIDAVDMVGLTAMHAASAGGDGQLVRALVRAGANPTRLSQGADWTPLGLAARCNQIEAMAALLELPAVVDAMDDPVGQYYAFPLRYALWNHHLEATKLLLDAGANPYTVDFLITTTDYVPPALRALVTQAKTPEPDRCRLLRRLRTLADASHSAPAQQPGAAPPPPPPQWVAARLVCGDALPNVEVNSQAGQGLEAERLAATAAFALRLGEGGLPPELFVELLDLMVPRWDAARRGQPLGENDHMPAWVPQAAAEFTSTLINDDDEEDGDGDEDEDDDQD